MRQILIFLCMCFGVQGMKATPNNSTILGGGLGVKERNRRLIPYMTYYLGQPTNQQYNRGQVAAGLAYVPVSGLGYNRGLPQRYIPQSTPLTRMITQNYLAMMKQIQQGDPRLPQQPTRIVNENQGGEIKYYIPLNRPQQPNIIQIPTNNQYTKPSNTPQYIKAINGPYLNPIIEQEQINEQTYAKPSPDALIQYSKPEVQQYVTNIQRPIQYKKQQLNYDNNSPQIQYITQTEAPKYTNDDVQPENIQPVVYGPKQIIRIIPKLSPRPSPVPQYITKPLINPYLNYQKNQQSVSIMQSQEIDVQNLPTTPIPTTKYHATYIEKPLDYPPYDEQNYQDQPIQQPVEDLDPELVDKNLNDVLQGLSLSKTLPERITNENLGSSIKTLSKILRILQRAQSLPQSAEGLVSGIQKPPSIIKSQAPKIKIRPPAPTGPEEGSTPGRPGIDYPVYDEIPTTQFSCKSQRYKGFFGDPETGCQMWHYCDLNGGQASFLCPNGTIFSQQALTCDWWFNVKCSSTPQLYVLNERLYKYILPQKPSFPEDYSGPLVDHYLSMKFKEIEEKNKNKTEEEKEESKQEEEEDEQPFSIDPVSENKVRSVTK